MHITIVLFSNVHYINCSYIEPSSTFRFWRMASIVGKQLDLRHPVIETTSQSRGFAFNVEVGFWKLGLMTAFLMST